MKIELGKVLADGDFEGYINCLELSPMQRQKLGMDAEPEYEYEVSVYGFYNENLVYDVVFEYDGNTLENIDKKINQKYILDQIEDYIF